MKRRSKVALVFVGFVVGLFWASWAECVYCPPVPCFENGSACGSGCVCVFDDGNAVGRCGRITP